MTRNVFILIILILLSFSSFAQPGKTEQQILDLSKRKFEWLVNKSTDSLKAVLDEQVKYIHSNGWTQTKQELIDDCISGKLVYQKDVNYPTFQVPIQDLPNGLYVLMVRQGERIFREKFVKQWKNEIIRCNKLTIKVLKNKIVPLIWIIFKKFILYKCTVLVNVNNS